MYVRCQLTNLLKHTSGCAIICELSPHILWCEITQQGFLWYDYSLPKQEETTMSERVFGYVRVSSKEQNLDRQLAAMREFGVAEEHIYQDKLSGKDFDRPAYRRLLKAIRPGDTLVFKSIDRLGRNYEEILEQWHIITKEKKVSIVVLDMPLLDTRQGKDLTGTLIADIVLQLLSYVAQTEREFIRQRQAEGIAAAREKGVHLGRMPKEKPDNYDSTAEKWARGELSARQAGIILGVSPKTFTKWVKTKTA